MTWWQIDTETLAGARFVISPVAEATGALLRLHKGGGDHDFVAAHRAAYRRWIDDRPDCDWCSRRRCGPAGWPISSRRRRR
ncbi:hypothetical protein [Catenuloplanes niger]